MKLYKLNFWQYLLLILLFALNYGYVMVDQLFLPEKLRPIALFIFVFITMLGFFVIIKPNKPYELSRLLSIIFGGVVLIIILITHVIITYDVSYKGLVILGVTFFTPFIVGWIFKKVKALSLLNKN